MGENVLSDSLEVIPPHKSKKKFKKITVQNTEADSGNKFSHGTHPRNQWTSVQRSCISVTVLARTHTAVWYQLIFLLLNSISGQYVILDDGDVAAMQ